MCSSRSCGSLRKRNTAACRQPLKRPNSREKTPLADLLYMQLPPRAERVATARGESCTNRTLREFDVAAGLSKTLALLATTKNEAAVAALIPALDSRHKNIQHGALRALLDRRSPAGQREIVLRLHSIDSSWKSIIGEKQGRLSVALRNAVLDADAQFCRNGCNAAIAFREYDLIAPLVSAAEDALNRNRDIAARALRDLASLLYDELAGPRDYSRRRDPQLVRRHVLEALEKSVDRFAKHKRVEILEAFLMLTPRDNALVKQILRDPHHSTFLPLIDVMTHSDAKGVMRLVLGYLDDPSSPHAAINVVAHRKDETFVRHLLKRIGYEPSKIATSNLKRVDQVGWLDEHESIIDQLDDTEQHASVQMVLATGMKRLKAFGLIEHLIKHGKTGGRRAAVAALSSFQGAAANQHLIKRDRRRRSAGAGSRGGATASTGHPRCDVDVDRHG